MMCAAMFSAHSRQHILHQMTLLILQKILDFLIVPRTRYFIKDTLGWHQHIIAQRVRVIKLEVVMEEEEYVKADVIRNRIAQFVEETLEV